MRGTTKILHRREIATGDRTFTLTLGEEDLSGLYPGMTRYTVAVVSGDREVARFRTNTYEYAPSVPLEAGKVAAATAAEWERELANDPAAFIASHRESPRTSHLLPAVDIVVVQGSPRAGGNCTTLSLWATEAARDLGKTVRLIFPDELEIRPCIGCYQCYNTGSCTFTDDMEQVIRDLSAAKLLVICSPVYTETVPGQLKILIDRCQAFHAAESFDETARKGRLKGIVIATAGRKGMTNLDCTRRVLRSFMRNLGIEPAGEILIDALDERKDVSTMPGMREKVADLVKSALIS